MVDPVTVVSVATAAVGVWKAAGCPLPKIEVHKDQKDNEKAEESGKTQDRRDASFPG